MITDLSIWQFVGVAAIAGALGQWLWQLIFKLLCGLWLEKMLRFRRMKVRVKKFAYQQQGNQLWRHTDDMLVEIDEDGTGEYVLYRTARKGYDWNGASIPWPASKVLKPADNLINSAPHDVGYQLHAIERFNQVAGEWEWQERGKRWFDALFFAMSTQSNGNAHSVADTMLTALHIGGHKAWRASDCYRQNACGYCIATGCVYCGWQSEQQYTPTTRKKTAILGLLLAFACMFAGCVTTTPVKPATIAPEIKTAEVAGKDVFQSAGIIEQSTVGISKALQSPDIQTPAEASKAAEPGLTAINAEVVRLRVASGTIAAAVESAKGKQIAISEKAKKDAARIAKLEAEASGKGRVMLGLVAVGGIIGIGLGVYLLFSGAPWRGVAVMSASGTVSGCAVLLRDYAIWCAVGGAVLFVAAVVVAVIHAHKHPTGEHIK